MKHNIFTIISKKNFLKHFTLTNILKGITAIIIFNLLRYFEVGQFILNYIYPNWTNFYSNLYLGLDSLICLFLKLPLWGVIENMVELIKNYLTVHADGEWPDDKNKHPTIITTNGQTHLTRLGKPNKNLPKLKTSLAQEEGPSNSKIKGSKSEPSYSPIEDEVRDRRLNWINPTVKEQISNIFYKAYNLLINQQVGKLPYSEPNSPKEALRDNTNWKLADKYDYTHLKSYSSSNLKPASSNIKAASSNIKAASSNIIQEVDLLITETESFIKSYPTKIQPFFDKGIKNINDLSKEVSSCTVPKENVDKSFIVLCLKYIDYNANLLEYRLRVATGLIELIQITTSIKGNIHNVNPEDILKIKKSFGMFSTNKLKFEVLQSEVNIKKTKIKGLMDEANMTKKNLDKELSKWESLISSSIKQTELHKNGVKLSKFYSLTHVPTITSTKSSIRSLQAQFTEKLS